MLFADNPPAFFADNARAAGDLPPAEAERLQQEALAYRLGQLLAKLPPLAALAQAQGLDASVTLDEAPRLFFPYSFYKAYDPNWLLLHDFGRMTRWLQGFTTRDLAWDADLSFPTVDAWLDWLRSERGQDVLVSSGTSGGSSLVALGSEEFPARHRRIRMMHAEWFERRGLPADTAPCEGLVWPASGSGNSGLSKLPMGFRDSGDLAPDAIVTLYERDLGIDYELYVTLAHRMQTQGEQRMPAPPVYVEEKLAEAERRRRDQARDLDAMLDRVAARLAGKRVLIAGGPHGLAALARRAAERGMAGSFAPYSRYNTAGGLKGFSVLENWEADVRRFAGSDLHIEAYGMSELGSSFVACPAGRFHLPPWVIVWVLDPANGWRPFPRSGTREGRGAFLDLSAGSFWGGVVSGDHLKVSYEPCGCGSHAPSFGRDIKRVADAEGDASFTPASATAIAAALEVLLADR